MEIWNFGVLDNKGLGVGFNYLRVHLEVLFQDEPEGIEKALCL
jgi:hypothetical protein